MKCLISLSYQGYHRPDELGWGWGGTLGAWGRGCVSVPFSTPRSNLPPYLIEPLASQSEDACLIVSPVS